VLQRDAGLPPHEPECVRGDDGSRRPFHGAASSSRPVSQPKAGAPLRENPATAGPYVSQRRRYPSTNPPAASDSERLCAGTFDSPTASDKAYGVFSTARTPTLPKSLAEHNPFSIEAGESDFRTHEPLWRSATRTESFSALYKSPASIQSARALRMAAWPISSEICSP
jgi:hypothetical protein